MTRVTVKVIDKGDLMLRLFKRTGYLIRLMWARHQLVRAIDEYDDFQDNMSTSLEDLARLVELRNRMEIISMRIVFILEEGK